MIGTRAPALPGDDDAVAIDPRRIALVCFLSGASGLIFEVVWFHRAGLVFGNSVWATSLVLSSFMGGLTVGAAVIGRIGHRIRRILHAYAAAELMVALSGVTLTHLLPALTVFLVALTKLVDGHVLLLNGSRFASAFALLL